MLTQTQKCNVNSESKKNTHWEGGGGAGGCASIFAVLNIRRASMTVSLPFTSPVSSHSWQNTANSLGPIDCLNLKKAGSTLMQRQ